MFILITIIENTEKCLLKRMTLFIKAKLKKSDDQTKIDKNRGATNITEYHIISKLIVEKLRL